MFGYVKLTKDALKQEKGLFQAFMCGVCLSSRKYSYKARMAVGNDITFLNLLFHSFENAEMEIYKDRCVSHPFTKRTLMKQDEITERLSDANVILTYLSLEDKALDKDAGLKGKLAQRAFVKDYQSAKAQTDESAQLAQTLLDDCAKLRELEEKRCNVLDEVCHFSAKLLSDVCGYVLCDKATKEIKELCYIIGKWVYLVDAVDDYKKDCKSGAYNPLKECFESLGEKEYNDVKFLLYAVSNKAAMIYNDLNLEKYRCVIDNVIYKSFREENERVINKLKGELWVTK